MVLKQMAKTQDRRLVRRGGHAKVHSSKAAKHGRLIEGFFHATSVITLKPAIRYQFKTGQRDWPKT
jgi:hypothetical protein